MFRDTTMKMNKLLTIVTFGLLTGLMPLLQISIYAQATENTKSPLKISNRTGIKVVVQVNYSDTMPNGISKQVMTAKNLYDQYFALALKSGVDYEILMVFRADGAQFLLTDEAYDLKMKEPHPKDNPPKALIEEMQRNGVRMSECCVAMTLKGYKPENTFAFSRVVISDIGAVVDFGKSGYLPMTP